MCASVSCQSLWELLSAQLSSSAHGMLQATACTLLTPIAGCFCRHCYSEHLAYLPNCYFVNDYKSAHMDVLDEPNLPTR